MVTGSYLLAFCLIAACVDKSLSQYDENKNYIQHDSNSANALSDNILRGVNDTENRSKVKRDQVRKYYHHRYHSHHSHHNEHNACSTKNTGPQSNAGLNDNAGLYDNAQLGFPHLHQHKKTRKFKARYISKSGGIGRPKIKAGKLHISVK